jgi:glyoxylase I family protein
MAGPIGCAGIHHLRLTVTDVRRSREFYTGLLGFEVVAESPPPGDPAEAAVFSVLFGGVVMARDGVIMGLRPMAPELDEAERLLDTQGVIHGPITRLESFGIDVLSFQDPDGIQLELTAPVAPAG